jgi:2-polyprenyl-6-methoxyphenol hydroxylase-like FAD-dependent oxidoreductase
MSTTCDVLVVGAGVAGAAAAVAAARSDARTILVEKEHYLGGTGFAGKFQYICGLYLNAETMPTETLNPGLPREIAALLQEASPERPVKKIGQVYVLPYTDEDLQAALTGLCYREKNIATLRGQSVTSLTMDNAMVASVVVEGMRGQQVIAPHVIIDCSGNGSVAAMAQADFALTEKSERQLAGYVVHVKGLHDVDDALSLKVPYHLAHAVKQGMFAPSIRFTTFSPGDAPDEGYCKMSIDAEEGTGRDDQARKEAIKVHAYLAMVLPAFKDSCIVGTSLKVLDREGRRITGDYTLTKEGILAARKFPDGVVKNSWPIELWDRTKGTVYR